jgi:hypothetical protein
MTSTGVVESILATLEYRVKRSLKIHVPDLDNQQVRDAIERHISGELTWSDLWDLVDTLDDHCDAC